MPALAYILVLVEHGKISNVAEQLLKFDEVKELHELYGEFDIIAKIEATDMASLKDFIEKRIRPIKEIRETQTLIASDVF